MIRRRGARMDERARLRAAIAELLLAAEEAWFAILDGISEQGRRRAQRDRDADG